MTRVAILRGAFLNNFEMQNYNFLSNRIKITAFAAKNPIHKHFSFETIKLQTLYTPRVYLTRVVNFIANRTLGDSQILLGLEKFLQDFDIVHTADPHYYYSYQAALLRAHGKIKKLVVTSWETIPLNNETVQRKKMNKYFVLAQADTFLCHTQRAKDCLIKEGVKEDKVTVIPLGVDFNKFYPRTHTASESLKILFAGRLVKEKGVLDLYETFKALPQPHFKLQIVGDGSLKELLKRRILKDHFENCVSIQNSTYQDMPAIYQNADIFVLPSKTTQTWEEQYGMVLIEAMASGLPVIAAKSGAIPEVSGDATMLVEEGNIKAWRSALLKMRDKKLRQQYSSRAVDRAKKIFNAQEVSEQIYTLYSKTLEQ